MTEHRREHHNIIKHMGVVSFFTLLSRITGLVRDMAIAYIFGTRLTADAFFVAFRIPNLLRRLSAEGALSISFIPVFTSSYKKSPEEGREVFDVTFTLTAVVLLLVSVAGILLAPLLVRAIAYGFTKDPQKFEMTVFLTRVMFPYILLISLCSVAMGVLNSLKHFAVPAASQIILNIAIIASALWLTKVVQPPILGLALGVMGGGIIQLGVHFPVLKKKGFFPRFKWDPHHEAVKKIVGLMLPAAYGAAVYQFNVIVITFLASFLASGSVSYLWYADRVMEFPVGIFGIAVATVILPTLAEQASEGKTELLKETLVGGLRLVFFITVPATVGLIVLSSPIVQVLFEHGSFSAKSTIETTRALYAFSLGLPFIAGVRVLTNTFFALRDSKTPVKAANLAVVVNIALSLILMQFMAASGLALAISLAAVFNFVLQIYSLKKKLGHINFAPLISSVVKVVIASVVMGGMVYLFTSYGKIFFARSIVASVIVLTVWIVAGVGSYMGVAYLLGSPEVGEVFAVFTKEAKSRHT